MTVTNDNPQLADRKQRAHLLLVIPHTELVLLPEVDVAGGCLAALGDRRRLP